MRDALARLTGPAVEGLLAAALEGTGERLLSWRVRSVDLRPGRDSTAAYEVRLSAPHRVRVLGARTTRPGQVDVWAFPRDPELPGLLPATDETAVRSLLDLHGVEPGPVELHLRSYRPARRAVVEVRTPSDRLFLKVVRPQSAPGLHLRHRLVRDAGLPVPRSRGWREDGVLLLEALTGGSLRTRLREGAAPDVTGPVVLELLGALPVGLLALPRTPSRTDEVRTCAAVTAAALPAEGERCRQLADRVRATASDGAIDVPVHGDLHEAQLLLDGGRISGLMDLDTLGPGRRADDLACLLGHLAVLAELAPAHAAGAQALAARWQPAFESEVDPVDLRARVAGVVLSLAAGPHRVQSTGWPEAVRARLDLAEAWLESAGRVGPRRSGRR